MKKSEIQKILDSVDYNIARPIKKIRKEIDNLMMQKSNTEKQLRLIHNELEKLEETSSYVFEEKLKQVRQSALNTGDFTELDSLLDLKNSAGLKIPTLRDKAGYYVNLIGRLDREIGRLNHEISEIRQIAKWRIFESLLSDFISKNREVLSDLLSCDTNARMNEFVVLLGMHDIKPTDNIDNGLNEIIKDAKKEASE